MGEKSCLCISNQRWYLPSVFIFTNENAPIRQFQFGSRGVPLSKQFNGFCSHEAPVDERWLSSTPSTQIICNLFTNKFVVHSLVGGAENEEVTTKKATEEELSFIKSSICEQWKKLAVGAY